MNPIADILAHEPFVLLDGGLASELADRGHDLDDPLWSAKVLLDDPAAIGRVHRDYFAAGADVATTASYQASLPGLRARGLSDGDARDLLRRSVALARAEAVRAEVVRAEAVRAEVVRAEADRSGPTHRARPLVVASLGSYGATVPGGAEYNGAFGSIDDDALVAFHAERLAILRDGADVVAFETIPSLREARAIARVLERDGSELCAWVAFTCRDAQHTGAGDRLEDCVAAIAHAPGLAAIGINCTPPSIAKDVLVEIGRVTTLPAVAYPNAGEAWAAGHWCGTRVEPGAFAALARRWWAAGARLLGGCCRTTPAHIAALAGLRTELRAELGSHARS